MTKLTSFFGLLCVTTAVLGETVRLPVTQDNSIVMVQGEWSVNAGASGRIRIKGNQHIVALGFDAAAVQGRTIRQATLVCEAATEKISAVTISTIAAPWEEMTSTGLTSGVAGLSGWGYAGGRFPAVTGGNSFTLVHHTASEIRDGRYYWDVPADMIHALATGVAFGLAIHEHDADYRRNPTIYSREQSGRQPYLIVETDERPRTVAEPPTDLVLVPLDGRSAQLTLRAPEQGFAYQVAVDGQAVASHNVPLVDPGERQTVWLRDLPDDILRPGPHDVSITTINRVGTPSHTVTVQGNLFQREAPAFPELRLRPVALPALPGLAVVPVMDKFDERGQPVGSLPADYRINNAVFDGRKIRLTAAAGEVVGFQTLLRGEGRVAVDCRLNTEQWRTDLWSAVYVPTQGRRVPDPLLPLPERITLQPDHDRAVFVDLYVPFDAAAGMYNGRLEVSDGRTIPLELTVLPVQLPRKASFLCEMNGYGLPDHVDDYYALQQVAYDHRVHANILHYSHRTAAPGARKSNLDMRLPSGRRMDNQRYDAISPGATTAYWDDFSTAFGPFLDGSYFRDGHRGPIPAPGFYLTFHESWPLNCRSHFNGNPDAYQAFTDSPDYARTYINVLADFTREAKAKGWTETGFHVYFNNKGSLDDPQKAPWILDEPAAFWDYRALRYFGSLTNIGRAFHQGVSIYYRVDISRPEYCRGQLARTGDLWVVSASAFRNYGRLIKDRIRTDGLKVWTYGTANPVQESNRQLLAWAVDAWRNGATGLVPWQTVDKSGKALRQADQLGLFIYDKDAGGATVVRHSIRLKAFREAQQLVEYLLLVQQKQNWSHAQMQAFVDHYVDLAAVVHQTHAEDAGTVEFGERSLVGIDALRMAAVELLR